MKNLYDICLVGALIAIIYMTESWWQLIAILPFILLVARYGGEVNDRKAKPKSVSDDRKYVYDVLVLTGNKMQVECKCAVQFHEGWAHFTDELTGFDFITYEPHASFYRPMSVKLLKLHVVDTEQIT